VHLSVVIPAYNESRRLPGTLDRVAGHLSAYPDSWEIVVADDGSTDDSAAIVERYSASEPRIRLLRCPHGGKGSAVRAGMLAAAGRWRLFVDADLPVDLAELPRFLEVPTDVAIGSREAPGARRIGEPRTRHLMGRTFNMCAQLLLVPGINDTQCGCKLFSASAARQLFTESSVDGFAFDVELLFLARRAGFTVREVPLTWHYRPGSRVRLSTGLKAFGQLLTIWWERRGHR
jgi:glycosyltransferase involved in cell wall biosynthesis